MASKKFRFVSPGVQLRELDQSQIPDDAADIGPVIIGRAERGPTLKPVRVESYSEFVQIFGEPSPGGRGEDVWRDGGEGLSPTYGVYAAQAWLRNSTPLTFVRLAGQANTNAGATSAAGAAGWQIGGASTAGASGNDAGGAFGLFLIDSGTAAGTANQATGTLASVIYTEAGFAPVLSGTAASSSAGDSPFTGSAIFIENQAGADGNPQFKLQIVQTSDASVVESKIIDFSPTSGKFVRKLMNTNPTTLTDRLYPSGSQRNYVLGETYETTVAQNIKSGSTAGTVYGVILGLNNASKNTGYNENLVSAAPSSTSWFISQDLNDAASFQPQDQADAQRLFKILSLEDGTWAQKNLKVSITDLRYSTDPADEYGTFSILVRSAKDSDAVPQVVESFANVNLNPDSPNYIAARIGTQFAKWDGVSRRYRYYGEYPNQSKYIRMVMADGVETRAISKNAVPFGFYGQPRFVGFQIGSGSQFSRPAAIGGGASNSEAIALGGKGNLSQANFTGASQDFATGMGGGNFVSASFTFPATRLRANTKTGNLSSPVDAYFGVVTTQTSNLRFDREYLDLVRGLPGGQHTENGPSLDADANFTEYSYIFTLDDVTRHSGSAPTETSNDVDSVEAYYLSGSRNSLTSLSATGSNTYKNVIDSGFDSFTAPMFGGFDGTDITQTEPFNNYVLTGKTEVNSYAFNSIRQAIDSCADPELVEMNVMSMPGLTNTGLTDRILDLSERRADTLGIIDIEGGYVPPADRANQGQDYDATNKGDAETAARTFANRQVNNSYGATYYPWTRVRDSETGTSFFCPPSVPAIGTLSYSQAVSELWFAPAGFNRGGLSAGTAGIAVVGVTEKLSSRDRDKLYEANINPIASFPSEGLVVFGQKTTQQTRSALDRINVRRLLIYVKKEISRISNGLLFDPNTEITWERFKGQAIPFLDSVKARLGLEDYKVVLDSTTTTPDLIDRNVMYAKIFLKPTRAIEFIAVDFVITNTGAAFED
jgi:hypothetical protein